MNPVLQPVANPEAEQSVLGAILVRPECLAKVEKIIGPKDFYREAHSRIFKAMLDLYSRGEPVDLVTVNALLKERGQLDSVGGPVFLSGLSEQVGFATNSEHYAHLVREKSLVRRLHEVTQRIALACQAPVENISDFLLEAESQIFEVTQSNNDNSHEGRVISAKAMLGRTYVKGQEIISKGVLPRGGGLIIAGESGDGKSLLRTELAIHLAMGWEIWGLEIPTARRVFIFTFENPESTEAYRLKKMIEGLQITAFPDDRLSFSDPTIRLDLGTRRDQTAALDIVRESGADVVIYDPLTSLHTVNENDNVQIRKVLDTITEINRKTGTTAIVIHHFGKPQEGLTTAHRTRGASSIKDWADTLIAVSRKKHEHKTLRLLEFIKVRNGPEPKPVLVERDEFFLHTVTQEDVLCPPERVKAILEALGGRVEGQDRLIEAIMEATNCGDRSAREFINLAIERQTIKAERHPTDGRKKVYVPVLIFEK